MVCVGCERHNCGVLLHIHQNNIVTTVKLKDVSIVRYEYFPEERST
jgi:hypothetical protein